MFRALQYVILAIAVIMTVFYTISYEPEMTTRILLKVDVFGITNVVRNERERVQKIRALTIPYDEKQVLLNRTVFMEASQEMVMLALGEPKSTQPNPPTENGTVMYVYYLGQDKRPTILVFNDNKLVKAYKGSALDINNSSLQSPLDTAGR